MTETPIQTTTAPAANEPVGYAPISTTASRSTAPTVDQLAAMDALTAKMAGMDRDPAGRERLMTAVHDEMAAGGSGLLALGADPSRLNAEAQHRAIADQSGDAAPAGATPAAEYTVLAPHAFQDADERDAFGAAASAAGLDVRVVASLVAGVAGDKRIADAIAAGDAGMDRRVAEVRQFFERQPAGMDDLRLAVAYGEHLARGNPKLAAAWDVAIMSEDALFSLASEARRLGFTAPARR